MIRQLLVCGGVLLAVAATEAAETAPRSVYFWSSAVGSGGMRASVDNARPGTWGNGKYEDARRVLYEGAPTLKITTRNFREGVRFDLKNPVEVDPYKETGYIRLRVRFKQASGGGGGPAGGGAPAPTPGSWLNPGVAGEPRPAVTQPFNEGNLRYQPNYQLAPLPPLGVMNGLPAGGLESVVSGPPDQQTSIHQLLVTLVLDKGIMEGNIEIPREWKDSSKIDFDKARPDASGWLMFVLPIKNMKSTPDASGSIKRLLLSGDQEDSFHLTQIAMVAESDQMKVSIRRLNDPPGTDQGVIQVRPGPVTLVADVEAGAADPAIEWNFDASNVGNLPPAKWEGQPAEGQANSAPAPGLPPAPADPNQPDAAPVVVGPRIDARGLVARFQYPNEEQNYVVEVTVRDRSGKKEPVKAAIKVEVRANAGR